ncbi:MAG: TorF family putative porin [Ramlibacter sp.]
MQIKKTQMIVLSALALSGTAFAQDKAPEPDYTLTYNIGAVTDYRFRGISQTSKKPAIQGGIDFAHKSGFYLGTFVSNVKWVKDFNGATKGSYELDLYGGYKGEIMKDLSYDVGLITYRYPGNNSGAAGTPGAGLYTKADTNEIYGALTYTLYTVKYSRSLGDFLGNPGSSGSDYLELAAGFDLGSGITLTPHIGHQRVKNTPNASYTDYSLTVAKDFGNGLSASAAAIGSDSKRVFYTDLNNKYIGNSTIVLGVKYSF